MRFYNKGVKVSYRYQKQNDTSINYRFFKQKKINFSINKAMKIKNNVL